MKNRPAHRHLICFLPVVAFSACVKDISSEERLERATRPTSPDDASSADALAKVSCLPAQQDLLQARNDGRTEAERMAAYIKAFSLLTEKLALFEQTMAKHPDLAYREESKDLVAAKNVCTQMTADVRLEFERLLRDLVDVPTAPEIRGKMSSSVPRVEFGVLRQAIEMLDPEDREQLLSRVALAEKKVDPKADSKRKK